MITLERSLKIDHKPHEVFELLADPARYEEFFVGITRWRQLTEEREVGARFRVLMKVGSIEAGGVVEVDRWEPPDAIAWSWRSGVHQTGAWTLEESDEAATEVTLRISFELGQGPIGYLVERIAGRMVGRNLQATLFALRRVLDQPA